MITQMLVPAAAEASADAVPTDTASAAPTAAAATAAPTPSPSPSEGVKAAEGIKAAVSSENSVVGSVIETLDSYGIDVGSTHLSLWSVTVVLLVLAGIFAAARFGSKFAHWILRRITRLDDTQKLLTEKLTSIVVWALALLIGIDVLGIDLTALAVFSGAFGLAIGFGLQKTFGNLIAGIILLMDRSIKPGDVITVSDTAGNESFGQIRKIGIRAVSVITRDMKEYLIPNENLMVNQVENWSYSSREVRVKVPVGVAYNSDIKLAEKLMLEATKNTPRVLVSPTPRVLLMGFGNSSVDFEIRFWITDPEEGMSNIRSDVLKRLWVLFHENGIEIPFPQRDLNLRDNPAFRELLEAMRDKTAGEAKRDS